MKGMVFTEFLEMVETRFSADMVDDIIADSVLASGGAYTSVGTYDHEELVQMVSALSQRSALPVATLVHAFGVHLFGRFHSLYPGFFAHTHCALDFLEGIETVIHTEVRKLYPDAQLPQFDCERTENGLNMVYSSPRHFGDLAEGLIQGAIDHFGESLQMVRHNLADGSIRFEIAKLG